MFGSAIVDVTIGVVFVYLLLGLVITAGTELMASALRWRANSLRAGVRLMLSQTLAQELYDHPMIQRLSKSTRGPSYIPSDTFALVLVDVIANSRPADGRPPGNLASLMGNVRDPDVRRVLNLLAAEAGPDGQRLKESIEKWFNTSMDRVSGWYKRKTQVANVILAVVFTLAVNADSIHIVRSLSSDSALRAALVAQAQAMVRELPAPPRTDQRGGAPDTSASDLQGRIDKLTSLGVPVGWTDESSYAFRRWPGWLPADRDAAAWAVVWRDTIRYHSLGWLLTALAASLGAPFWFDILKKIITIRSAGKVPEEKLEPARGAPGRATGRP